ncbi:MAG: AAA family ATPase [Streptosporangiales bacterium]|nr:AAA family ATPase [Streptosporangiales bacterium]
MALPYSGLTWRKRTNSGRCPPVRLGVLGPLTVSGDDGTPLHVGGVKRRALLAALALSPNQTVPVDRLTAVLWGDEPPQSYVSNLQTYVSGVRRVLARADAAADGRITHDTVGYRLTVGDAELDLLLFRSRLRHGREAPAGGDAAAAAEALGEALALWRGEPLAGLDLAGLTAETDVLTDELAGAAEDWAIAGLELGDGAALAPRLRALITAHPLRERLRALLIRALAAAGRQAEALEVYREGCAILAEELGIEPGAELRAAHGEVLRGDDAAPAAERPPAAAPPANGPFPLLQLPYDIPDFTGRDRHVRQVCHALTPDGTTGLPLVTVSGSPGVGKTALAVHVAHRLRPEFPDGQLFAHLGGASRPRDPAQILAEWLRALGVAGPRIPDDTAERAAAFRSRLADRRVLVVLDDAAEEAQVRPLLPGTSGSAVLVTARNRLAGLAGGRVVALEPLSQLESRDANLLDTVAGPGGTEYHLHDLLRVYAREVAELAAEPADTAAFDAPAGVTLALADAVARREPKSYGTPPEPVDELVTPPADEPARPEADPPGWLPAPAAPDRVRADLLRDGPL